MKTAQYSKKHDELQSTKNTMNYNQQKPQWITVNKEHNELQSTRKKIALFSRLFIFCQTKQDLEHFFSHENHICHPYLSEHGSL